MRVIIEAAYLPFVRKLDKNRGEVVQRLRIREIETGALLTAEVGLTEPLPTGVILAKACNEAVSRYAEVKDHPETDCRRVSNYRLITKTA